MPSEEAIPTKPDSDPIEPVANPGPASEVPADGSQGPNHSLAKQYDHYIEINGDNFNERLRYHLIATSEIVSASTGDIVDNSGWFGHAHGIVSGYHDGYYFDGSLLNIFLGPLSVGEWRRRQRDNSLGVNDLPYAVFVNEERIDHDCFDPRTPDAGTPLDIELGYRKDGLPGIASPTKEDADHIVSSWEELDTLDDAALSVGDTVVFDQMIEGPAVNGMGAKGSWKRFNTDGLTFACVDNARLESEDPPSSRWGNIAFELGGKHCSLINFEARGSCHEPRPGSDKSAAMGVVFTGRYPVMLNGRVREFGQSNIDDRGIGATVMGVDSFDSQVKGSGYGIASSGPAYVGAYDPDQYDLRQPWHERTSIKFCRIDGCRHGLERGTNGATEARWYVIGKTTRWGGAQDDCHRFARSEDVRTDRVVMQGNPVTISDWVRGRARLVRIERTWYEGWNDQDWDFQKDPRTARRHPSGIDQEPIAQRCARDDYFRDRDRGWEKSDGPLLPHPDKTVKERDGRGSIEWISPDSHVWQFDSGTMQFGGTRPDFIDQDVYDGVKYMRNVRRGS